MKDVRWGGGVSCILALAPPVLHPVQTLPVVAEDLSVQYMDNDGRWEKISATASMAIYTHVADQAKVGQ